jgi:acetyltransferase-like isoleucine patch superfamily enzyme
MIRLLLTRYLQKSKDQNFSFDDQVTTKVLLTLFLKKLSELIRFNLKSWLSLKCGGVAFIGRRVVFENFHLMELGKNARVENNCVIGALGKVGLKIGHNSSIGVFSRIIVSSGLQNLGEYICIGNNVGVGGYANIGGSGGVSIGDDTIIGPYFSAHPENHIFDNLDVAIRLQGTKRAAITIEENCWIGAKVTVLAGVTIGKGSIIGAGAVVTKSIPEYSIAVGNPATILKTRC